MALGRYRVDTATANASDSPGFGQEIASQQRAGRLTGFGLDALHAPALWRELSASVGGKRRSSVARDSRLSRMASRFIAAGANPVGTLL